MKDVSLYDIIVRCCQYQVYRTLLFDCHLQVYTTPLFNTPFQVDRTPFFDTVTAKFIGAADIVIFKLGYQYQIVRDLKNVQPTLTTYFN